MFKKPNSLKVVYRKHPKLSLHPHLGKWDLKSAAQFIHYDPYEKRVKTTDNQIAIANC